MTGLLSAAVRRGDEQPDPAEPLLLCLAGYGVSARIYILGYVYGHNPAS